MATVLDLINASFTEIGVRAEGETLTASQANDALTRLNRFLDRLAAENLSIYTRTRTTATLTASQTSFTVGSGGNINIARPVFIDQVNFIDTSTDPDTEYPMSRFTDEMWEQQNLKALTAYYPQNFYYEPTYPLGTLYPWPVPTASTLQWAVYAPTAVTQFSALTTSVSLPPSYEEMLVTNLALLLCPSYERQPNPMLVKVAQDSMATLKRVNRRPADMSVDPAALIGQRSTYTYDIRRG